MNLNTRFVHTRFVHTRFVLTALGCLIGLWGTPAFGQSRIAASPLPQSSSGNIGPIPNSGTFAGGNNTTSPLLGGSVASSGLGNLTISEIMGQMQGRITNGDPISKLGINTKCDYSAYVKTLNTAANNDPALSSLINVAKPGGRWGLPSVDILGSTFQMATRFFTKRTMAERRKALSETVEQMCQPAVQTDEIERQLEVESASRAGTARSVQRVMSSESPVLETRANYDSVGDSVRTYMDRSLSQVSRGGIGDEAAWKTADLKLQQQEEAAIALRRRVEDLTQLARAAYSSFFVLSDAQGNCPSGGRVSVVGSGIVLGSDGSPRGVCGQGTPERATQIESVIDLYEAELQMLTVTAEARRVLSEAANHQVWAFSQERLQLVSLNVGTH